MESGSGRSVTRQNYRKYYHKSSLDVAKQIDIGPYVNENAFDFDVSDITKRMVLIGGKNGAGKTTLFNAIKICLYGCVAYGFESNNAKYFAEIEKIINANEKLQKIGEAEVVIDLLMDDGKYDHTYTFVRSWRVAGKKIAETFTVHKDGETLSETEKSDFESYSKSKARRNHATIFE